MNAETLNFPSLVAIMTAIDFMAIISARYAAEYPQKKWIKWLSVAFFASAAIVYVLMLFHRDLAVVNIIYLAFSTVLIIIACYFLFKEKISLGQAIGMAIALGGVVLLEL